MKDKMILYMSVCYILEPNKSENSQNKLSAYAIINFKNVSKLDNGVSRKFVFEFSDLFGSKI